ncbi:nickel pincer cofactor biosynthesis protein LarC [Streptomyces sp. 4N509B]|uniref:nickel pincer cofactor biosynthesis protein LarC n=1 Tax=Streptomyces sp. 4N509B TaxID=3457413 RepID=UPI003FD2CAB3
MVDAWFQCASGASGDMLLGALLDAGASLDAVREAVGAVRTEGIEITTEPVRRAGLAALKAHVHTADSHHHRGWSDIRRLLQEAGPGLAAPVRDRALATFHRLAEAEARAHGLPLDEVHFHEVGALDAIADVVGVCAALHDLGVDRVGADTVAVGSGTVQTSHGRLPVPVPAVVALLGGVNAPVTGGGVERELCTPTGAALLATFVQDWGPVPAMRLTGAGAGAGTADIPRAPNVLRVVLGDRLDRPAPRAPEATVVLAANVDDLDPRLWPVVLDRLLAAGADDAWLTPILMKKGRPAHTVSALVRTDRRAAVRETIFRETSSIGVRETPATKHALDRTETTTEVAGHPVRLKVAWLAGEPVNVQAEHDDLLAAATATGIPVKELLRRATASIPPGG